MLIQKKPIHYLSEMEMQQGILFLFVCLFLLSLALLERKVNDVSRSLFLTENKVLQREMV